jgi:hypothetical protein
MPLTGRALIGLTACCTVAVLAGTVLVWGRWGRLRYLLRPAGVLLSEALLLVTVGLVVNRQEGFYPTWAALLDSGSPGTTSYRVAAGSLDRKLAARVGSRGDAAQEFAWHPSGWTRWRLAGAPEVVTPAGYLRHPGWRYSVVLVVDDSASGWSTGRLSTAEAAGPAVVVYTTTTAATQVQTLARTLPGELDRDLRVTTHRWAIVASASDAGLADQAAVATRGLYPAIVTVPAGAATPEPLTTHPPVIPALAALGAGSAHRRSSGATKVPAGIVSVTVHTGLTAAIAWAAAQTPPPLAASAPPVKFLPTRRHTPRGLRPSREGTPHVTRQPRH